MKAQFWKSLFILFFVSVAAVGCGNAPSNDSTNDSATQENAPQINPLTPTPVPATPAPIISGERTISSGGIERRYLLHIPTGYDGSKSLPLVLIFHGGGGTAEAMAHSTQMNAKADQEGFIVAYLQGTQA